MFCEGWLQVVFEVLLSFFFKFYFLIIPPVLFSYSHLLICLVSQTIPAHLGALAEAEVSIVFRTLSVLLHYRNTQRHRPRGKHNPPGSIPLSQTETTQGWEAQHEARLRSSLHHIDTSQQHLSKRINKKKYLSWSFQQKVQKVTKQ